MAETTSPVIPREIINLTNLTKLNISGLGLTSIPDFLAELTNLRELNICDNKISIIPEEIINLPNLKEIKYGNNPLIMPPIGIANQGIEAMKRYYKLIERDEAIGSQPTCWDQAKLIIVGKGTVGKTSLMNKIVNPECELNDHELMTRGVKIIPWSFRKDGKDYSTEIWDFGGQHIYYSLHELFLTKRSLYLYVWESRSGELTPDTVHQYWLNAIRVYSDNCPVIVIRNKCDDDHLSPGLSETQYKENFENIRSFHNISCLTNQGLNDLFNVIKEEITKLPHVRNVIPAVYLKIKQILSELATCQKLEFIDYSHYREICLRFELSEEDSKDLISYLHDLGVVLYREEYTPDSTIVLNPDWATGAFYLLIDNPLIQKQSGKFNISDLASVWNEQDYPLEKHRFLVELLCKYEYCFKLGTDTETYIIPELLPKEELPDLKLYKKSLFVRQYSYECMPEGIFTRIIAKIMSPEHGVDKGVRYWQHGIELNYIDTAGILIICDRFKNKIDIYANYKGLNERLEVIRDCFRKVHDELDRLNFTEYVPCVCENCSSKVKIAEIDMYDIKALFARLRNNKDTIRCRKDVAEDVDVTIKELLTRSSDIDPMSTIKIV